jgi:HSP20 family molecular chaperone IbpA
MKHIFIVSFLLLTLTGFSQNQFVFSGIVTDSLSGKVLEGVDILVKNNLTGTISSNTGEYQLYLQSGFYQVVISGIGYKEKEIQVEIKGNTSVTIELEPEVKTDKKRQGSKRSLYPLQKEQAEITANIHS